MMVDSELLSALYTGRLQNLRQRAENSGISKSGSVEVLRARLISRQILMEMDLSWEGIQSMSHTEMRDILKVFGIKSSGSHKERRQRLWLHLNYDSRRMTIENLAEMNREDLHEMCKKLELDLTGNRTVLMGRVAGVLTSQMNGWGRIKRSLRRNGIPDAVEQRGDQYTRDESVSAEEYPLEIDSNFHDIPPQAVLEDAADAIILGAERLDQGVQTDLKFVVSKISDLERMVGTILRGHGGRWGEAQKELILRLAIRRGWPVEDDAVRTRMSRVATDMAEIKGARLGEFGMEQSRNTLREEVVSSTSRTRIKETMRGAQRVLERPDSN